MNAEREKAAERRRAAEAEAYQRSQKILEGELARDRAWRDAVKQVPTHAEVGFEVDTQIQIIVSLVVHQPFAVLVCSCFHHCHLATLRRRCIAHGVVELCSGTPGFLAGRRMLSELFQSLCTGWRALSATLIRILPQR